MFFVRKSGLWTAVLLVSAIALSGCIDNRTGDVGNKNIRPNSIGMKSRFANDQDNEQNRSRHGERVENNNVIGMHGNSRIQMSDQVAKKIATMPGIDSAFVVMTDHNAYVAVKESPHSMSAQSITLMDATKDKIADQVKSMSPSVENVFVSTNPDFLGRMESYASEARNGHPIQGLLAEFNAMVERVFPAPSGTGNR
jgi:YhcN/YlaJ family sporulation lipoprotein